MRLVIFVSLRMAASAVTPLTPMELSPRLQGVGGSRCVSTGADTIANTSGAAAHLRLVIFVSLRTAASTVAPSASMPLHSRLRARDKMGHSESVGVSMGADRKPNTLGGGRRT